MIKREFERFPEKKKIDIAPGDVVETDAKSYKCIYSDTKSDNIGLLNINTPHYIINTKLHDLPTKSRTCDYSDARYLTIKKIAKRSKLWMPGVKCLHNYILIDKVKKTKYISEKYRLIGVAYSTSINSVYGIVEKLCDDHIKLKLVDLDCLGESSIYATLNPNFKDSYIIYPGRTVKLTSEVCRAVMDFTWDILASQFVTLTIEELRKEE